MKFQQNDQDSLFLNYFSVNVYHVYKVLNSVDKNIESSMQQTLFLEFDVTT